MREIIFHKMAVDQWRVSEYVGGKLETRTYMTPDQVGLREASLIREGFTLYTNPNSLNMRIYRKA
jgi:hypothetical protein